MGRLIKYYEDLRIDWGKMKTQWLRTAEVWKDSARASFEKNHFSPMEPTIAAAMRQMEKLDEVVQQARKEVR